MKRTVLFSLTGHIALLFVACASLIPVVTQRGFAAPATAAQATNENAVQSAGVTDALKASFGSAVQAVTAFQPF